MKKKIIIFFVLFFLIVVLLAVFLLNKPGKEVGEEIKEEAVTSDVKEVATSDIAVVLDSASIKARGLTKGIVNVKARDDGIQVVRVKLIFDSNKVTISDPVCSQPPFIKVRLDTAPGSFEIACAALGGENAVVNRTATAVTFNVTALSAVGDVRLDLGENTVAMNGNGLPQASNKTGAVLRIEL